MATNQDALEQNSILMFKKIWKILIYNFYNQN